MLSLSEEEIMHSVHECLLEQIEQSVHSAQNVSHVAGLQRHRTRTQILNILLHLYDTILTSIAQRSRQDTLLIRLLLFFFPCHC